MTVPKAHPGGRSSEKAGEFVSHSRPPRLALVPGGTSVTVGAQLCTPV